jgi:hypothetical protein
MLFADPQNRLTPLQSMHRVKLAQIRGEDGPPSDEQFHIALTFSDGSSVDSSGGLIPEGQAEASLTLLDGSGGGVVSHLRWYVEPLPPPGQISFSCEWPMARIALRHTVALGIQIQEAAKESKYLGSTT